VIVIDTSALAAIIFNEPAAGNCETMIVSDSDRKMSAGTAAEAMIVADSRGGGSELRALLTRLNVEVVPVTPANIERVAEAYRRWGKGNHPASLNFGDCFAYALAKELSCPLVFIGNDFARTDVMRA
jgi:ribonuclease VapC